MQTSERLSLEQIQAFLDGSGEIGFKGQDRGQVYGWVDQTLRQQRYEGLLRSERGLVRRYVEKMTGLSGALLITCTARSPESDVPVFAPNFCYTHSWGGQSQGCSNPASA